MPTFYKLLSGKIFLLSVKNGIFYKMKRFVAVFAWAIWGMFA